MNRRDRRRQRRRPGPPPATLAAVVCCPDCNSEVTVVEVEPGRYRAEVAHDETCPWFTRLRATGGLGVRFF